MRKLLTIKHWQYFLLLMGPSFLVQVIAGAQSEKNSDSTSIYLLSIVMVAYYTIIFFGWFYSLGVSLYEKLSPKKGLNMRWFKISILIPVLSTLLFIILALLAVLTEPLSTPVPKETVLLIIPFVLINMCAFFYMIWFTSKALRSYELKKEATFGEYAGLFFLSLYFFIGIWFIQPRVNKIFGPPAEQDSTVDGDATIQKLSL